MENKENKNTNDEMVKVKNVFGGYTDIPWTSGKTNAESSSK